MNRKRITQIFPWLMPIRKKQRLFCFYMGMKLDRNRYAVKKGCSILPHQMFASSCPMYNKETGFEMIYQENKVHNLKLAAATIDRILIRPNETFSFWKLVRYADKHIPYKDGLVVVNGELKTAPGGGLCQMSNLLFWLFVHTPLTIMERHGHKIKDFPEPKSDAPIGVDAAVSEGWLDLKVKNETDMTFQIVITFDEETISGQILTDKEIWTTYEVFNENTQYFRKKGRIYEETDVMQRADFKDGAAKKLLYRNRCEIGYQLPDDIEIKEGA